MQRQSQARDRRAQKCALSGGQPNAKQKRQLDVPRPWIPPRVGHAAPLRLRASAAARRTGIGIRLGRYVKALVLAVLRLLGARYLKAALRTGYAPCEANLVASGTNWSGLEGGTILRIIDGLGPHMRAL